MRLTAAQAAELEALPDHQINARDITERRDCSGARRGLFFRCNTLTSVFADEMTRLGARGRLALAVSGGADSMALAELARDWAGANGASVQALVVDHGLRAGSAAEAALTAARLEQRGVVARVLTLAVLAGPALQARARAARHQALAEAARAAGCMHLLLGHHAGDQAETVAMRAARGAGGAEGMAAWAARRDVVLLRPLLGVAPADLRALLRGRGVEWVEDPSNNDPRFERARLRAVGSGGVADPAARLAAERETAAFLARYVTLRPEGFALVAAEAVPAAALAALLRVIGGRDYPPSRAAVARLARLRPGTLGGARITPGRGGWLLAREPAACAPPVPAVAGAVWDGRFRLPADGPVGAMLGALGADAARFRKTSDLPALVLRGMPCLRLAEGGIVFPTPALFAPPAPLASHPWRAELRLSPPEKGRFNVIAL